MPRQARLDYPGQFYHVMARGIEKRNIFRKNGDYRDFIKRLSGLITDTGTRCFAWALLPNHLHLLLEAGTRGLAGFMRRLLTGYAVGFNLRYDRVGHLFQNRYKSILCDKESYFRELVRYIHLNPLRAGIVSSLKDLENYPWTGHPAVLGYINNPWQEVKEVLGRWSQDSSQARKEYLDFLRAGTQEKDLSTDLQLLSESPDDRILGDSQFVEQFLDVLPKQNAFAQRNIRSLPDLAQWTARFLNIDVQSLWSPDRSREASRAKSVFISLGTDVAGRTIKELAACTKMSGPAASKSRQRGRQFIEKHKLLPRLESYLVTNVP